MPIISAFVPFRRALEALSQKEISQRGGAATKNARPLNISMASSKGNPVLSALFQHVL